MNLIDTLRSWGGEKNPSLSAISSKAPVAQLVDAVDLESIG